MPRNNIYSGATKHFINKVQTRSTESGNKNCRETTAALNLNLNLLWRPLNKL